MKKSFGCKSVAVFVIGLIVMFVCGCNRMTVADAYDVVDKEAGKIARNLRIYHEQKKEDESNKKENGNKQDHAGEELPDTIVDEESAKKIQVVEQGEVAKIAGYEVQVTDCIFADNIFEVSSIASEADTEEITKDLISCYGPDSNVAKITGKVNINNDGSLANKFKEFMFLKVKIKSNIYEEICMCPIIYSVNDKNEYIRETMIDIEAVSNRQQEFDSGNRLYYMFDVGQEYEYIFAFSVRDDSTGKKLLMSTKFLSDTENYSATEIRERDVLIRIGGEN